MCCSGFLLLEALILKHSHQSSVGRQELEVVSGVVTSRKPGDGQNIIPIADFRMLSPGMILSRPVLMMFIPYNRYYQVLSSYSCGKPLFSFVFL